jgi:integrase
MKSVTPYMMSLHTELQEKRGIADQTASQYIRSLYSLNNNRPFTNLAWLKNRESVSQRLSEFAESTQKTLLSVIVSALSTVKDKATYKRIYTHYYNEMMSKAKEQNGKDTSEKTDKQEANWLSWDVVKAHEERLKEDASVLTHKDLTPGQWDTMLSYMVLSLFTHFDPRRNQDYQLMYVVKSPKQATDQEKNYITMAEPRQFIFHKYKTSKTHGTQTFPVPEDLNFALSVYLSSHPLLKSTRNAPLDKKVTAKTAAVPFLVHDDGTPLTAVNALTRIFNRIFGKRVGSTMLRHIYLSAKYDVEEMNETADRMGHTGAVQRTYLKKESDVGGSAPAEESQSVTVPTILQG